MMPYKNVCFIVWIGVLSVVAEPDCACNPKIDGVEDSSPQDRDATYGAGTCTTAEKMVFVKGGTYFIGSDKPKLPQV